MAQPQLSSRAARTRLALLSAGMELLADRPVDAIAIDEFVESAGVAKGSFFNHFKDKQQFASAITHEIRVEIEQWVGKVNLGVSDPLERLAGGMISAAAFALSHPQRTIVLARSFNGLTLDEHPINAGLLKDLRDACVEGQIFIPSEQAGVMFWLGSCQTLMGGIVESRASPKGAEDLLINMLQMCLRGLGASDPRIAATSQASIVQGRLTLLSGSNDQAPAI